MPLLSGPDRDAVASRLEALVHDVTLVLVTQTIGGPETCLVARQIVDEVASLSGRVAVEEANFVLDRERVAELGGIEGVPALAVLRDGEDTRIRFLGAPSGYEFMSLVEAVALAGGNDSGLSAGSREVIARHATAPVDIKVFVTPTCPHCPRAVTTAHRMAVESPNIRATCVEASEFIDLSRKYNVTGVPKTVVNDAVELMGAVAEDEFVRTALSAPAPGGAAPE